MEGLYIEIIIINQENSFYIFIDIIQELLFIYDKEYKY